MSALFRLAALVAFVHSCAPTRQRRSFASRNARTAVGGVCFSTGWSNETRRMIVSVDVVDHGVGDGCSLRQLLVQRASAILRTLEKWVTAGRHCTDISRNGLGRCSTRAVGVEAPIGALPSRDQVAPTQHCADQTSRRHRQDQLPGDVHQANTNRHTTQTGGKQRTNNNERSSPNVAAASHRAAEHGGLGQSTTATDHFDMPQTNSPPEALLPGSIYHPGRGRRRAGHGRVCAPSCRSSTHHPASPRSIVALCGPFYARRRPTIVRSSPRAMHRCRECSISTREGI